MNVHANALVPANHVEFNPSFEESLPENVKIALQTARATIAAREAAAVAVIAEQNEARKRAMEEERNERWRSCELELMELWFQGGKEIGVDTEDKKRRKCSLEYMESAVALLKQTVGELKGINEVGAGRRCQ
jgi:hypothetical protein